MNELGARVRLVKGAYREPKDVAFQEKEDVDRAFIELMQVLLRDGHLPGHRHARPGDDRRDDARSPPSSGTRHDTRSSSRCSTASGATCSGSLAAEGYPFRVYVPFGTEWFPYFMRRLGERPANVGFVAEEPRARRAR